MSIKEMPTARILYLEDDIGVASPTKAVLEQKGYSVIHVEEGMDALTRLLTEHFDGAICDLTLPDVDGLKVIESIRSKNARLPIIILSARSDTEEKLEGLRSGGNDYLTKPFAIEELLTRLKNILMHRPLPTQEEVQAYGLLQVSDLIIDPVRQQVRRAGNYVELRSKEYELLHYMVLNPNRILTKEELLREIWNYPYDPSTRIVDNLVARLRKKMDQGYDIRLIYTRWGKGYYFKNPDADISKMSVPEPPQVAEVPEPIVKPEPKPEPTPQYGPLTIPPPSAYLKD
ncbi:MAG: response regulator transcription factor [bacterium]|jgi:two-component system OmpR family response regulator